MDLITHGVLVVSAVCFTLGVINLRLWMGNRERLNLLAMSAVCLFGGAYALFELAWLHSVSASEFGEIARWSQIASWGTIVSLATFLHVHLQAGRMWLFWAIVALRTFGMLINFAMPVNIHFREMTAVEQVTVLGERLSSPIGVPNPWYIVPIFTFVLLLVFALDALVVVWRRGERRKALIFGGSTALLCLTALSTGWAIFLLSLRFPPFVSPALMFIILGMAIEFDYDLKRSARLAGELTNREIELTETLEQLNLSVSAGQVGIWARDLGTDKLWVNQKMRELFEFGDSGPVTVERFAERVHADDRKRLKWILDTVIETGQTYEAEYRIQLQNGGIRWMRSMGQVHDDGAKLLRGAAVDITRMKLAEEDAHELSRKLMVAQEKERARLARELHDDLSQSLAILSIQLQSLVARSNDAVAIEKHVEKLTGQIQRLSSDVHRISHELHPSKLTQLGLESALGGFCREAHEAHGLKIGFKANNVPRSLPNDISLCFYRIAQEALQNTVKHSGASTANVELTVSDDVISLVVTDNGSGFDPEKVSKESLGLVSMHERIRAVDGVLTVGSVPGSGTTIEAQVPLPKTTLLASESRTLIAADQRIQHP
jgi:signal transduction histidine kinase